MMNSLKPGLLKTAHEKTVFAALHLAWDIQHNNKGFPYGLEKMFFEIFNMIELSQTRIHLRSIYFSCLKI